MNFPDEEATELVEAKWLRKYAGMLGYIQLGFIYQGIVFLHETTTEWYERFQTLLEDIESLPGHRDRRRALARRRGRVKRVSTPSAVNRRHCAGTTCIAAIAAQLAAPALDRRRTAS